MNEVELSSRNLILYREKFILPVTLADETRWIKAFIEKDFVEDDVSNILIKKHKNIQSRYSKAS